jgi:hypothetical protein
MKRTKKTKKREQRIATIVKKELEKGYFKDQKHYKITANCKAHDQTDVLVKKDGELLLQVETKSKNANLFEGIGEAMYYFADNKKRIPTFLAVPYNLGRFKRSEKDNWDGWKVASDIYDSFGIDVGVLLVNKNKKLEVKRDSKGFLLN